MSLLKVDTIKPVTSSGDLSLQGDSGGSAVDCLNITSAGDINFTGNTDAKIKLPSGGGIYESNGSTPVLTESGGVVSLGSAVQMSAGGVLQVLQAVKTDTTSTTSATFEDMTEMTISITPRATSSKILVFSNLNLSTEDNDYYVYAQIMRATTAIYIGDTAGDRVRSSAISRADNATHQIGNLTPMFLDSPSTTSATVYKIQWRIEAGTTGYLNRSGTDTDNTAFPRTASSITVMEIAG
jgi:hypothetical protein